MKEDGKEGQGDWQTFITSSSVLTVLESFRRLMSGGEGSSLEPFSNGVGIRHVDAVSDRVRAKGESWKDQALFRQLHARAAQEEYSTGSMDELSVLISGAGPSGLRAAIEAAMHGAEVTVVELRHEFTRRNCLHLWPFMVEDLRSLHIKHFYPAFCSGAVEHVNIADLQLALLKVALLLGVEVHCDTAIKRVALMKGPAGTRISLTRRIPQVESRHFDVLLAADGEHSNVLQLLKFKKKYFHGGRSIGITCNFVNHKTAQEAGADEFAIATQYHPRFFGAMKEKYSIELENLTYYRDSTHYFVMTATKASLLERGVIMSDRGGDLVAPDNVNEEELVRFVHHVGRHCDLGFALELAERPGGGPDVQIFDYSSKHVVATASKSIFPNSRSPLLVMPIGDAALAPFWPLGTGANRGTLMALDTCWIMRLLNEQKKKKAVDHAQLLREHERLFKICKKTMAENLKDHSQSIHAANAFQASSGTGHFSVDPSTRYRFA